ncbi:hypothetical protein E1262_16335 [Jiangella aurantiaca]|uniref:Transcriptional regulator LacI/GalR-like sensor domain-containing protein n=1 Tax=Jiangella aurantiaca TaxID=2530373 RepID=A0A4V2YS69_9ACTN|nr:substrate-binding domain-containing protein [Jiangella aurantiaca]TDD68367.1 hypothetical protein E1262_16335 [Jiangella aurantiaca]
MECPFDSTVTPRSTSWAGSGECVDDTYAAAWTSPRLTTVRQPMREMGRVALRTLLSLAQGQRPETYHFELATTLIERSSMAPLD